MLFLSYSITTLSYSSLCRESQTLELGNFWKNIGKPKTGPEGCDCHPVVTSRLDYWLLDPLLRREDQRTPFQEVHSTSTGQKVATGPLILRLSPWLHTWHWYMIRRPALTAQTCQEGRERHLVSRPGANASCYGAKGNFLFSVFLQKENL